MKNNRASRHLIVISTRPKSESLGTCKAIFDRGFSPLISPALEITRCQSSVPYAGGIGAILVTSKNAVFAVDAYDVNVPIIAVGAKTGSYLRQRGRTPAFEGHGSVKSLLDTFPKIVRERVPVLLHLSGAHISDDLSTELAWRGIALEQRVVYRADPVPYVSSYVVETLVKRRVSAVLFFSVRSALIWRASLAATADCSLRRITAVCMSERVSSWLREDDWYHIRVADRPNEGAILDRLDGISGRW